MSQSTLKVKKRIRLGKGGAKEVRREGNIPAILYGKGEESIPLIINPSDLKQAISNQAGRNTLLNLEIDDNGETITKLSLLREIQIDYLTQMPIHIDLTTIDVKNKIHVNVPVHFNGTPVGVKDDDGILEELIRELQVECLPGIIPNSIEVDVSGLGINDAVHVRDLDLPEGVTPLHDEDETVVIVGTPSGMSLETETVDIDDVEIEGEEGDAEAEEPEDEENKE